MDDETKSELDKVLREVSEAEQQLNDAMERVVFDRKIISLYQAMLPLLPTRTAWRIRTSCHDCLGVLEHIGDHGGIDQTKPFLLSENEDHPTQCSKCGQRWTMRIKRTYNGETLTEVTALTRVGPRPKENVT